MEWGTWKQFRNQRRQLLVNWVIGKVMDFFVGLVLRK